MKKFSFTETIIIINLVMAVLTGIVWVGLKQAREARRRALIEQLPSWESQFETSFNSEKE